MIASCAASARTLSARYHTENTVHFEITLSEQKMQLAESMGLEKATHSFAAFELFLQRATKLVAYFMQIVFIMNWWRS